MVCITLTAAVRRALLLGPLLSISLLSASASLQAQEVGDDGSTVIYTADYFAQWSPVTAQDMMNRIPGMSSGGGGGPGGGFSGGGGGPGGGAGGRGLGGGGGDQILIDGKRVAGKANEANSQLSRISADKVLRIELIRGTATDLDVRGDQVCRTHAKHVRCLRTEFLTNKKSQKFQGRKMYISKLWVEYQKCILNVE
jgi:outer membrane receptor protein involved in Fe transport